MKINKSIASVVIFAISLALIFLFVFPKYKESRNLKESLAQKQAEYTDRFDYYNKVLGVLRTVEERKVALEKIDSALPSSFSFASTVYFLQQKGQEDGLTIKSILFSQPQAVASETTLRDALDKKLNSVVFTANVSGDYQSLKKFLLSLEKSSRIFEVSSISFVPVISSPEGQQSSEVQDFKLEIKTYAYQ